MCHIMRSRAASVGLRAFVVICTVAGSAVWQDQRGQAAGGLALDKVVSAHQTTGATTVTSPAFSTVQAGELLVAFVTADGPASAQSFSSVTGGGLTPAPPVIELKGLSGRRPNCGSLAP